MAAFFSAAVHALACIGFSPYAFSYMAQAGGNVFLTPADNLGLRFSEANRGAYWLINRRDFLASAECAYRRVVLASISKKLPTSVCGCQDSFSRPRTSWLDICRRRHTFNPKLPSAYLRRIPLSSSTLRSGAAVSSPSTTTGANTCGFLGGEVRQPEKTFRRPDDFHFFVKGLYL